MADEDYTAAGAYSTMGGSRQVAPARRRGDRLSLIASLRPHKHPKATGLGLLWLLGLYAVFFAPAPVKLTPEKIAAYQEKLKAADGVVRQLAAAERQLMEAEFRMQQVQVWFWRWRPEHRAAVEKRQPAVAAAKVTVRGLRRERDAALRLAKQQLGVWSEAGLEESRALLWRSFESGKVFAQRQTFWDSVFTLIGSRDKDWLYLLLQLLCSALINYTVGAVMSVITFAVSLPTLLASFAPTWPSAVAFFFVAVVGAVAVVASYLFALFAAGAAVVGTTLSFATTAQRQRLAAGGGGGRRQRLRYGHYD